MTMTPDPLSVVISAREIYDAIARLTGRVDVVIAQNEDMRKKHEDHELRLRALERNRWPLPTVAVLVAVASLAVAIITKLP